MQHHIIVCRSLTYAQHARKVMERSGLFAGLVKAPQTLSDEGCGYGVQVRTSDLDTAKRIMRENNLTVSRVIDLGDDGAVRRGRT